MYLITLQVLYRGDIADVLGSRDDYDAHVADLVSAALDAQNPDVELVRVAVETGDSDDDLYALVDDEYE